MSIYIFSRYGVSVCTPINNNFTLKDTHVEYPDAASTRGMTITESLDCASISTGNQAPSLREGWGGSFVELKMKN
jgi:hypothetical protein